MKALLIIFTLLTISYGANKIQDDVNKVPEYAKVHRSPWQTDLHLLFENEELSDNDSTEESPRIKRHEIEPEEKHR